MCSRNRFLFERQGGRVASGDGDEAECRRGFEDGAAFGQDSELKGQRSHPDSGIEVKGSLPSFMPDRLTLCAGRPGVRTYDFLMARPGDLTGS